MTKLTRTALEQGAIAFGDMLDKHGRNLDPIHPGIVLREEWLEPQDISAYRLAKAIHVPLNRITAILAGERAITADTALRLARFFSTDAQSWINLQARYDLAVASLKSAQRIAIEVEPFAA